MKTTKTTLALMMAAALIFAVNSCSKPEPAPELDPIEEPEPDPSTPDPSTPDPSTPDPSTPTPDPVLTPVADLLDLVFNEDGSATDASAAKNTVQTLPGSGLMTYRHPAYGRYVAHYSHTPGASVADGFYKVNFTATMANGLADGHTLEVVFSSNFLSDGSAEYKMFSAMDSGGTGWLISKTAKGCSLTFLPHVGGNYCWASSGINPQPGRYYHAVGVWNKEEGTAKVYVDGVLKGSVTASGEFTQPANSAAKWWSIGGDSSKTTSTNSWNGDVVLARVYDKALTADEVSALYSKVKIDQSSAAAIDLKDLSYLPYCDVKAGTIYYIYGTGFKAGDVICLGDTEIPLSVEDGRVSFTVPSGLASGSYAMLLKRGTSVTPVGKVVMNVGSYVNIPSGKVVAHRGYYKSTNLPENSLAALTAAQNLGVWGSEFDVWATTDDRVVVNHDKYFPTDASKTVIQDNTFAALSAVRLSNGESVPTLEAFLAQGKLKPEVKLVCEVKTHTSLAMTKNCIDLAVKLVKGASMEDQVVWIAFDHDACLYIKTLIPSAHVQYLDSAESTAYTPETIKSEGLDGIDYKTTVYSTRMTWFSRSRTAGVATNVWTVDSNVDMLTYFGAGADYVTTNYPETALGLFAKTYLK